MHRRPPDEHVFVDGVQVFGKDAQVHRKSSSSLSVKEGPVTKTTRKYAYVAAENNDDENKAGGEGLFAAGNRRIKKKTGKRLFVSGAMVTRPLASINRATFQLQALFSAPRRPPPPHPPSWSAYPESACTRSQPQPYLEPGLAESP